MNKLEDFTEGSFWRTKSGFILKFHSIDSSDGQPLFTPNESHPFSEMKNGTIGFSSIWIEFTKIEAPQLEDSTEKKPNAKLMVSPAKMLKFIESFVHDFETDYVMPDGAIVDNPNSLLLTNYKLAKNLLEEALN